MPSLLFPSHPSRFPPIVPKSFTHPSQTDSPPSLSPPLPFITSAAATSAATPSSGLPAAATSAAAPSAVLPADATSAATPSAALPADATSAAVPQAITEATRPSVPPGFMPCARGPLVPPASTAALSSAAPAAIRPLVPPGFMARVRAPPGFATVQPNGSGKYADNRPNTHQAPQAMFGPSVSVATSSTVSGRAHEAVCQAMLGEIRTLTSGFDRMRMEVEQLRRINEYQGTLITGLKEEERAFEENKKVIGDLEGNVGMLIDHAEEKDRVLNALEGKAGKGEEDNRALRRDVGNLKEEIRHLRRLVNKIWVGASVVGGCVLVGGVVAWVRKN